jgi:energy-coupling factor transporter ATP-binding protein EcfA2
MATTEKTNATAESPTFEGNVSNLDGEETLGQDTLEESFNELIKDHSEATARLREISGGYLQMKEALEEIAGEDGVVGAFAEHVLSELGVSEETEALAEDL